MPDSLTLTTGARLHFGLIRFGQGTERQFGGVGAMISRPELRLVARSSERFTVAGPLSERVQRFAEAWRQWQGRTALPPVALQVESAPPEHAGLGVGTQLGLAVARALERLGGLGPRPIAETAQSVGRGKRSAIGIHGFELGGLIYEAGKAASEALSPLVARVALPTAWRFLLLRPREITPGLAGERELRAFETLPPVPEHVAARLIALAEQEIVPAARAADFGRFSAAVGQYNQLSGSCYKSCQGGAFSSPHAAAVVAQLQADGIAGVGQSSWGPTLFALCESSVIAEDIATRYRERLPDWKMEIAEPRNHGADENVLAADEHG